MKREYNYDLLRVLCCLSVVIQHLAAMYTEDVSVINQNPLSYFKFADFLQMVTRFAVPCFVMLSGAFLLESEAVLDFKKFYKKSIEKIVIPTIAFSLLYIIYRTFTKDTLKTIILDTLRGQPTGHMWYMYMLFGLYILVPWLSLIKKYLSEFEYLVLTISMLILGSVIHFTCELQWFIKCLEYVGYLLAGDFIRSRRYKISAKKAIISIVISITLLLITYMLNEYSFINDSYVPSFYRNPNFPTIIVASLSFFVFFTWVDIDKLHVLIENISKKSFLIYLVHPIIYATIDHFVILFIGYRPNPYTYIPILFVVTVCLSIICSSIYDVIYNKLLEAYQNNAKIE